MIASMIRQMWNERKANVLILLELLVVFSCLLYAADYLYVKYKEYKQPLGFDISHVYKVWLGVVPETSADYDTTAVHTTNGMDDFFTIVDRLEKDSRVETVGYTSGNHFHYMYFNRFATFHGIKMQRYGFVRDVDPSYFRVFKVKTADGQSWEKLENALRNNQIVVTATVAERYFGKATEGRGKDIWITNQGDADSIVYHIGEVCEPQRYQEFSSYDYAYYRNLGGRDELKKYGIEILSGNINLFVRMKPSADKPELMQQFKKDMEQQLRLGNIYLSDVTPMSYYREEVLRSVLDNIRLYVVAVCFLLFNVLLGVVGTFWFRARQRIPEIGLRMAVGASRTVIFIQLIGEGLILLAVVTLPAVLIYVNLGQLDVLTTTSMDLSMIDRLVHSFLMAFLTLAMMIVAGIIFPAKQAARLNPTETLKDE